MQIINKTITVGTSRTESIKVYGVGDMHCGAKGFAEDKFMYDIERIKNDPSAYIVLLGDMAECINTKDKRFDIHAIAGRFAHCIDNLAEMQTRYVVELLMPVKDKILGIVRGNHERHILRSCDIDMTDNIAHRLGIPNLQDSAFIILHINSTGNNKSIYTIYVTHGNVAGRKSGGKANRLEDLMGMFEADIYMIGHGHKKIAHTSSRLEPHRKDNKWILKSKKKTGFMTGSYLKSYEQNSGGYAEQMMLPPSDIGAVYVEICPRAKETTYKDEIEVRV